MLNLLSNGNLIKKQECQGIYSELYDIVEEKLKNNIIIIITPQHKFRICNFNVWAKITKIVLLEDGKTYYSYL